MQYVGLKDGALTHKTIAEYWFYLSPMPTEQQRGLQSAPILRLRLLLDVLSVGLVTCVILHRTQKFAVFLCFLLSLLLVVLRGSEHYLLANVGAGPFVG